MGRSPDVQAGARASLSHQRLKSMADGEVSVADAEVSVAGLCYVDRLTSPIKDAVSAMNMNLQNLFAGLPSITYVEIDLAQVCIVKFCFSGCPAIWH
jgi:hypothetical protein